MTAYACREHPDRTVTRRGTGCPDCEHLKRRPRHSRTNRDVEPTLIWDVLGDGDA